MTREAELELEIARLREALDKCSKQLTRLGYSANHADKATRALKQSENDMLQCEKTNYTAESITGTKK